MQQPKGLTLIEVMVTVAIIAIIAGIAWPQYQDLQTRNRRAEGRTAILLAQAFMEKCYSTYRDYTNSNCDIPNSLTSQFANYDIGFKTGSRTTDGYTLEVTPKSGGLQVGDTDCALLSISNTGDKSDTTNSYCWPN